MAQKEVRTFFQKFQVMKLVHVYSKHGKTRRDDD